MGGVPGAIIGRMGTAIPAAELVGALGAVVGGDHVVTDPEIVAGSAVDFTGRFRGHTPALVRPGSADEVAAVVAWCAEHGVALVPQGGNTGLVGGSVPLQGEVLLSTRRLQAVTDVDAEDGQLTAGAGASLAALHEAAAAAGWAYGVDFSSRSSATVGGMVATNAGGVHVLRYGTTRAQLLGVEAVLGTGAVVRHLGGLVKDNTGYDLAGLLCGSEGTLGVVTAARLRLVPALAWRTTALVAFSSVPDALAAGIEARRSLPSLEAAELLLGDGVALVAGTFGDPLPFDELHAAYLLLEAAGTSDPTDELADLVAGLGAVRDAAVAAEPERRAALWAWRDHHSEAVATVGVPHKLDVSLPARTMAAFVDQLPAVVRASAPSAQLWLFGHVADGNLHVNVTGVDDADESVEDAVLELVLTMGGSISAEHGIGTAKRRYLERARSHAELAAFRALKAALDPAGICNPNVLLPPAP